MATQCGTRSLDDYFRVDREGEPRHEYFNGTIREMVSSNETHCLIAMNVQCVLGNALDFDQAFRVLGGNMRLRTPSGLCTYSDGMVIEGKPLLGFNRNDILMDPILLAEIMSPETEVYDRGAKFEHYRSTASLRTYLLIAQDRIHVEQFERLPSGDWLLKTFDSAEATMTLPSVNATLTVGAFYKKVDFPTSPEAV